MSSPTKENYLKTIFLLTENSGSVPLKKLSDKLGVNSSSANSMVKKLQEEGLVNYEKYKPIHLTKLGVQKSLSIVRKHRLSEMFLVEKMGFGWNEVHDIAEEMEHINSEAFFDRMDEILENPSFDPHGSPIPDKEGNIMENSFVKLSTVKVNNTVKLRGLSNSSNEFLEYLNRKHIKIGSVIKICSQESYDNSMEIIVDDQPVISISKNTSDKLLVEVIS